jgi:hypothetical protein
MTSTTSTSSAAAVAVALVLWAATALAQTGASCDQAKAQAPQRVEGHVVAIDAARGQVSVRGNDGSVHAFAISKDTQERLKVGDKIEARLRSIPNC